MSVKFHPSDHVSLLLSYVVMDMLQTKEGLPQFRILDPANILLTDPLNQLLCLMVL